ncbi:MAG TPA: DUF1906 domain-containing protein [Steroidobacteraceae bacterium]|nr:DUF1906 domain-containing protein [Steroidobacteraceae bacterium]
MANRSARRPKKKRTAVRRLGAMGAGIKGVDLSSDCTAQIDCLAQNGYSFVARYYASPNSRKILSVEEARAISAAGLNIVAVWEDGRPTSITYFSYSEGVDDGTSAYNMAGKIGQPASTPIYFAVDYDASDEDVSGSINDYFRGVRDGFNTISGGAPVHPIGAYGSGAVCSWLLARNMAAYAWLAQSRGWRGFNGFANWNIRQNAETSVCGLDVDTDDAVADYGGFQVP